MVLDEAVRAASELRDALSAEVEEAQQEGALLRALDAPALMRRATARAEFNQRIERLDGTLKRTLAATAAKLGLAEVTIAGLAARDPAGARALSRSLAEIRALASAMAELDRLNQFLAQRALRVVRGYVEALAPAPRAYDRMGQRATASQRAVLSTRV
ncbi:MAG TPA: flagellar export chaperone FlgN [Anaeromyxobacteraceae bacterium]|nr:flagellar export chaperone FlgN [Anaeromyxobacteraceae bacterium]